MSQLRIDPAAVVATVPELYAVARMLSTQAVGLYERLVARMADLGNESARRAFAAITDEQRRHAKGLELRISPQLRGPPGPLRKWGELAVFEDEDLSRTRLVTPYRALSVAVRNEERAFSFWTYISAHAENPEVKVEAERLAREELARVRELRVARRRAYHEGRLREIGALDRLRSLSRDRFLAEAALSEALLAAVHCAIAERLRRLGHPQAAAVARISDEEAAAAQALANGAIIPESGSDEAALPGDAKSLLNVAIERLEGAAEGYLAIAEASQREDVVAEAQPLAEAAVRRLSAISR